LVQHRIVLNGGDILRIIYGHLIGKWAWLDPSRRKLNIENIHVECECGKHTNLDQLKLIIDIVE